METRECVVCHTKITRREYRRPPERTTCSRRCASKLASGHHIGPKRSYETRLIGGYVAIPLYMLSERDRFLAGETKGYYVLEHRLVMARKLGRPLTRKEVVRHMDGNKKHNTDDNLVLGDTKANAMDHVHIAAEMERWRALATWIFLVSSEI